MKRTFTKEYILENRGCYEVEQVEALSFINNKRITLKKMFDELPVKDLIWFLFRKCELQIDQKIRLSLALAKSVEHIYNKKHPNDNRVKECNIATDRFLNGKITKEELFAKQRAAYAAAYAVTAAAHAAAAAAADAAHAAAAHAADAYAAAHAADAHASAHAADAHAADAYAADADDDDAFKANLWKLLNKIR